MRAQTTIDFAIGISIFLLTVVLVFAFVPGMLKPFNAGAQEETVGADRLASQLAEGMLAAPDAPYLLQTDCTVEFFRTSPTGAPACTFDQSTDLTDENGLTDRVGMSPRQRLNVTIQSTSGAGETLCWDETNDAVVPRSDGACTPASSNDVAFAAGGPPPVRSSSVVTARRAVSIDGGDATLVVRMW